MDPSTRSERSSKRHYLRLGMIVFAVLLVLGLLLFFTPRYLARYVIASQLDAMGIDYSGVSTLTINPFTRELWLGPVSFHSGDAKAARLESLGLVLRYNPLLDRHIYIERLIVRGIDLVVTRSKARGFELNGIQLDQLVPPANAKSRQAAVQEGWQPGIHDFELRDSRLILHDQADRELVVEVDRLALLGFFAWKPEQAGRFELEALVNDIRLSWTGEARPFADNIVLSVDASTEQADLSKVIRFTGPLGLDRQQGIADAQLKHALTFFAAGGMEGHTQGVIEISGADYAREAEFDLAFEQAKLDLDVRYKMQPAGDVRLQGKLGADFGPTRFDLAKQTRVDVNSSHLVFAELDSSFDKNGGFRIGLQPELELEQVAFAGPVEISVDKLLELLTLLQSLSAGAEVTTADTGLGDFADGAISVPSSEVKVARLHSRGDNFSLQSDAGKLDLVLQTDTDLFDIQVEVNDQTIHLERLQSRLERFDLKSGQGRLALDMAGSNSLLNGRGNGPKGELKIGNLDSNLTQFALKVETGALALQLAGEQKVDGFSGLVYPRESLPEVRIQLGSSQSALSQAALDLQGETLHWHLAGDVSADALTVAVAKGKAAELKFERAYLQALQVDEGLQINASAVTLDGLAVDLKRSLLTALREDSEGQTQASPSSGHQGAANDKGETHAEAAQGSTGKHNEVAQVQQLLTDLGFDPGPVDGRMGDKTRSAIRGFQGQEGINANGRVSAGLLAQLQLRNAEQTGKGGATPAMGLQVSSLVLQGRPVIRFVDDLVSPEVKVDTVFKEFQVQDLNTRRTDQPTDLTIQAQLNEFTGLQLKGWTKGIGLNADMDLDLQVKNLELATYSPYVERMAGVYLNSGQLDTKVDGRAKRGVLQGEIQLDLAHMEFKPLNKEDAARIADQMGGVPLETAVSLLQDDNGRIDLTLPLGGTLQKPDVDISSAVTKAIGGVLKRVFPPTLALSMLSKLGKGGGASFEPVEFAPGSAELDDTARQYLDTVVVFLNEHPKLSLKVCGRATALDRQELMRPAPSQTEQRTGIEGEPKVQTESSQPKEEPGQTGTSPTGVQPARTPEHDSEQLVEALEQLAVERKNVVRSYMVKDKGIDAARVPECRSTYAAEDQEGPRVKISM